MKKKRNTQKKSKMEMRTEYDFSDGVRGKYSKQYSHNNNLVVIARDVAEFFGDSQAVNEALRTLLRLKSSKSRVA